MTFFRLVPALSTHRGMRRKNNQDAIGYKYPDDVAQLQEYGALFIVADGVGSLAGGEKASRTAVERLIERYYSADAERDADERLAIAMQGVNQDVRDLPEDGATTLVAVVIRGDEFIVGSVGDSLAYRVRAGAMDKLVEEDVVRDPNNKEKGRLTRAIGYQEDLDVQTVRGTLQPDDRLLLCSDGLTRYLDTSRLQNLALLDNLRSAVLRMVTEANDKGGADNISVVLVKVDGELQPDAVNKYVNGLNALVSISEEPMMYEPTMTKPATRFPDAPIVEQLDQLEDEAEVMNTKPASQFPDAPVVPDTPLQKPAPKPSAPTRSQTSQAPKPPSNLQRNILPLLLIAVGVILLIVAVLVVPGLLAGNTP